MRGSWKDFCPIYLHIISYSDDSKQLWPHKPGDKGKVQNEWIEGSAIQIPYVTMTTHERQFAGEVIT